MNLALEILDRRSDGYHEIATVLQTVDLADRLILEDSDVLEVQCVAPGVPTNENNLALRAARALGQAAVVRRGIRITLDKRIPVAAGLGGGSSDAAAVLVALNRLWGLRWSAARLADVAETLGMDVPFFLRGGVALGTGRGERVRPLAAAPLALVLATPAVGVSTAEAYGRVTRAMYSDGTRCRAMIAALRSRRPARVAATLYNGLEDAVIPAHPEVGRVRAALLAAGALGAVMSGSGPTVFGVARSFEHARQIRSRVTRGSWRCWAVRTMQGPAVRMRGAHSRR